MRALLRRLRGSEIGRLGGDTVYAGAWQGAISVADLAQIALVTHALGLTEYGRLALAIGFVTLVGQFFDVRVGAAATTFGARRLEHSPRDAAGVFQFSYLVDLVTGVLGFVVVAALAPFVGPSLVGEDGTLLLLLYAVSLLVGTVDESSITVLRLLDRFRLLAGYTTALEVTRVALIVFALAISDSLIGVMLALVAYKALGSMVNLVAAIAAFAKAHGEKLLRPALDAVRDDRRPMLRMILHTNVVSYARLAQTQLPTVVIGAISGVTQVGLYKVGTAVGSIVGRLADPAYVALLPRISRLWAAGRHSDVRRLIGLASLVAVPVMAIALASVILLRSPILELVGGGEEAVDATTVLVLVAIGQAVNGALFWNIGVLFATGNSRVVSRIALGGMLAQVALLFPLVADSGAEGAAVTLLVSLLVTNLVSGWFAIRALRGNGRGVTGSAEPGLLGLERP
jgi:O-antigen/teichoic acid export membrane protein